MSVLSTVVREDVAPYLLAGPWVMLVGMIALCCTAEDRRACFRRWSPWLVLVGGLAAIFSVLAWRDHVRSVRVKKAWAAMSQARDIERAALWYYQVSGTKGWPAGGNGEVMAALTRPVVEGGESYFEGRPMRWGVAADGSALDPWGRAYLMGMQGEDGFRVWSAGPDGVDGTADDVRGF